MRESKPESNQNQEQGKEEDVTDILAEGLVQQAKILKSRAKTEKDFKDLADLYQRIGKLYETARKEWENTEDFIDKFILENPGLTNEAKDALMKKARTEKGPWVVGKDHVVSVSQQGRTIRIKIKTGEIVLYI